MSASKQRGRLPKGLYRRGPVYWGAVSIAGTRHRRSFRTDVRVEAEAHFADWKRRLIAQSVGNPEAPTVKVAAMRWATETLPKIVKPSTAKRYAVSIGQLAETMGGVRVDMLDAKTISGYIAARSAHATNATIRRDITALSRLLSVCVVWGYRHDNPALAYDRSVIRERRDAIAIPSDGDIQTVINAAPAGMRGILVMLRETGMRAQEAVTLPGDCVNVARRTITLRVTKSGSPRVLDWDTPGGNAGNAVALVPGILLRGHNPIFRNADGEAYRNFASNATQLMRRVVLREKAAGRPFRRFRVHDIRHALAVRWLRSGGEIYKLSRHMGHTSVKTTEGYLQQLSEDERRKAMEG
jgi:integrase/recombinase XerD